MAKKKLSDREAKKILLKWPTVTTRWRRPGGAGSWVRAQPRAAKVPGPKLSAPGARLFTTQPDGLWVYFSSLASCDVFVVEVCGTIANLNDKRSRYIPASHSLVLTCKANWFSEAIAVRGGGNKERWEAAGTLDERPSKEISIPVRLLRVLYALPNDLHSKWRKEHTPAGGEFYCRHSSLDSYNSQRMQDFLSRMSFASHFYGA